MLWFRIGTELRRKFISVLKANFRLEEETLLVLRPIQSFRDFWKFPGIASYFAKFLNSLHNLMSQPFIGLEAKERLALIDLIPTKPAAEGLKAIGIYRSFPIILLPHNPNGEYQ